MPNSTRMQRERTVSKRAIGALVIRIKTVFPDGSSIVFNNELAAASLSFSASLIITTCRLDNTGTLAISACIARICSILMILEILPLFSGST